MGTRSGSIDPAVVTYLIDNCGMTAKEVDTMLNKKSGVLGVSGFSSDFRDLTDAANSGNERADLAVNMFYYSVKKLIGTYAAAMGGIDALVFTGGIGENDAAYRLAITEGVEVMGSKLDKEKNNVRGLKRDVSADGASVRTLVISTHEELMIALDTQRLIQE